MKATTFAAISLLASAAVAQPHRQHQHMDRHHKREEPAVVWVTEVVSTTTTVDITTTIWVSEGFVAPTSAAKPVTTAPSSAVSSSTAASSVEQKPAQFFEPASSQKPSSTSVYVAPTPTTTPVAVAPVVASTPSPEPVKSSSSSSTTSVAPVYVPTTTAAPVIVAPTTTSQAAAATTSAAKTTSGGSSSGACSSGSPCTGEMTFYDIAATEYGSCGYEGVDGTKDKIVAISAALMGTVSNGNPMCGKTVTVKSSSGKTVVAKVVDKCPGCVAHAIDLSRAAFSELESFDVGRINVDWWFN